MEAARSSIEHRRNSIKEVWGSSRHLDVNQSGRNLNAKPAGPKRRWSSAEKKTHAAAVWGWSFGLGKSGRLGAAPAAAPPGESAGGGACSAVCTIM